MRALYRATRHGETLVHFFSSSFAHCVDRSLWHDGSRWEPCVLQFRLEG